jgi:hypothetical protein
MRRLRRRRGLRFWRKVLSWADAPRKGWTEYVVAPAPRCLIDYVDAEREILVHVEVVGELVVIRAEEEVLRTFRNSHVYRLIPWYRGITIPSHPDYEVLRDVGWEIPMESRSRLMRVTNSQGTRHTMEFSMRKELISGTEKNQEAIVD